MNPSAPKERGDATPQAIEIDEVFPHTPAAVWSVLVSGDLMGRWLMPQSGFQPVEGCAFRLHSRSDGDWNGVIHCEVLEVVPEVRLVFTWKSGVQTDAGYIPRLDTVVAWTLTPRDGGTRLRLVHSGFVMPRNASVFANTEGGWRVVVPRMVALIDQEQSMTEGEAG
jgi:uncharacterized protein YndB with AHSA1/START domain